MRSGEQIPDASGDDDLSEAYRGAGSVRRAAVNSPPAGSKLLIQLEGAAEGHVEWSA